MNSELNLLKGIHPGLVLNRELDKRHLRKGTFALSLQEYPQTLTAITKGKRGMNTALSLKIEKAEKYPSATEHIPEMIAMIQTLIEKERILREYQSEHENKLKLGKNADNEEIGNKILK